MSSRRISDHSLCMKPTPAHVVVAAAASVRKLARYRNARHVANRLGPSRPRPFRSARHVAS